ncbi:MAG TPA: hypothetical protein VIU12_08545 [Chryseolinea sp.]
MTDEQKIVEVLNLLTTASNARVESLRTDKRAHAKSLRTKVEQRNVVALGISEKVSQGKRTGKLALTFYVKKKVDPKKLTGADLIPPTIPESISGNRAIPTDVIVIGEIVPEINASRKPIQPGNSTGHVDISAGTLGALVVDSGKNVFILSNSHVLARSGKAKKGDNIIYPGSFDGGKDPKDVIAKLHRFVPFINGGDFVNHADCAIAKPVKDRIADFVSEIKGLGVPSGTIAPKRGMKVVKVGRTTGKTTGEIVDVNFRPTITYEEPGVGVIGFKDQVLCTRYTKGGDSGSLVIDSKSGKAVGLHFAGSEEGSIFTPIDTVLNLLGVQLVTRSLGRQQAVKAAKAIRKTAKKRSKTARKQKK